MDPTVNPIGYLMEFCQKSHVAFPVFEETGISGPDHCREFTCNCLFVERSSEGKGQTKKGAKKDAADKMVKLLQDENYFDPKNAPVLRRISQGLASPSTVPISVSSNEISILQEYCQKTRINPPIYSDAPVGAGFACECSVNGTRTIGKGTTKKTAKVESAKKMLIALTIPVHEPIVVKDEDECPPIVKNPISTLMEMCVKLNLENPEFEQTLTKAGKFAIVCEVGKYRSEGTGSNKQEAKTDAAKNMLSVLHAEGYNHTLAAEVSKIWKKSNCENVEFLNEPLRKLNKSLDEVLPDFLLDDEEDESITSKIDSLTLDDSLVIIEPSTQQNGKPIEEAQLSSH